MHARIFIKIKIKILWSWYDYSPEYICLLQDNNGTIELDEFLSMMAVRMKANEKIKQVFDVFDTDSDG